MYSRFLLCALLLLLSLPSCAPSLPSNSLVAASNSQVDSDSDGLTDTYETNVSKSNPQLADTDGDGVADGEELSKKTSPLKMDTDEDGLADGEEFELRTSAILRDTDGDGLSDSHEVRVSMTKPLSSDTDSDGVHDGKDDCPLVQGPDLSKGCP